MLPSFDEDFDFFDAIQFDSLDGDDLTDLDGILHEQFDDQFVTRIDEDAPLASMEVKIDSMNGSMEMLSCNGGSKIRQSCSRSPSPPRKRRSYMENTASSSDDMSLSSYGTAQSMAASAQVPIRIPSTSQASGTSSFSTSPNSQTKYNDALEKLAMSMRRTEESRSQIMRQRELVKLKEESTISRTTAVTTSPPQRVSSQFSGSIVSGFFSGSRTTLTTGLEQSRKQLRSYMNQINHQSL